MGKTSIYSKALKQKIKEEEEELEKALPKREGSQPVSTIEPEQEVVAPDDEVALPQPEEPRTKRSWFSYFLILLGLIAVVLFFAKSMSDLSSEKSDQELFESLVPSKYEPAENSVSWLGEGSEVQAYFSQNGGFAEFSKGPHGDIFFSYEVTGIDTNVGLRFKSEAADLSKFSELVIRVVPVAGQELPTRFHIELKSEGRVIRVLHAKDLMPLGEARSFQLSFSKPTPLSQVTLFLKHSTLDSSSQKGAFKLTHLHLVPKS